jgi:predicted RNA-binding protein Jag
MCVDDLSINRSKAETLNALQYIAGSRSKEIGNCPLVVDGSHRVRRGQQIRRIAQRMAEQASAPVTARYWSRITSLAHAHRAAHHPSGYQYRRGTVIK